MLGAGTKLVWTNHAKERAYERDLPVFDTLPEEAFFMNVEKRRNFDDRYNFKMQHETGGYTMVLAQRDGFYSVITLERDESLREKKFRRFAKRFTGSRT